MQIVPEYREQYVDWLLPRISPFPRDKALERAPIFAVDDGGVIYQRREDGTPWYPVDNERCLMPKAGHCIKQDAPIRCGACFGMTWIVSFDRDPCEPYPMKCATCGEEG